MNFKFDAFLSYKHGGLLPFSRALAGSLRTYGRPLFARPHRVFRDEEHLAPTHQLPAALNEALEKSRFLILLASEEAAASTWVQDELETWCGRLGRVENLIIVLTSGRIVTNADRNIDWDQTNALPANLRRYLDQVPLYTDLTGIQNEKDLHLRNPDYGRAINRIAARIHGIDPEELLGAELRQHRLECRLRNGAIALIALLSVLTTGAALFAQRKQRQALHDATISNIQALSANAMRQTGDFELSALLARQAYLVAQQSKVRGIDSLHLALQNIGEQVPYAQTLELGEGFVDGLSFSADDAYLVTGTEGTGAQIWSVRGTQPGIAIPENAEIGRAITATAPEGDWLAVAGGPDGTIEIWDRKNPQAAVRLLKGHAGPVVEMKFGTHGSSLASGGSDGTVRLWDLTALEPTEKTLLKGGRVINLQFTADGSLLIGIELEGDCCLYRCQGSEMKAELLRNDLRFSFVAFSDAGDSICFGEEEKLFLTGMTADGPTVELELHGDDISAVVFSPDGRHVAAGNGSGRVAVWDRQHLNQPALEFIAQKGSVARLQYSHDSKILASAGGADGTARLWRFEHSDLKMNVPSEESEALAFAAGGKSVFCLLRHNLHIYDFATRELRQLNSAALHTPHCLSSNGEAVAECDGERLVLWDVKGDHLEERSSRPHGTDFSKCSGLSLSRDKRLATWFDDYDQTACVLNFALPGEVLKLETKIIQRPQPSLSVSGKQSRVMSVGDTDWKPLTASSSNGIFVAATTSDRNTYVWTLEHPKTVHQVLPCTDGWPTSLCFSPTTNQLAVGASDGAVSIWTHQGGSYRERRITGLGGRVDALNYTGDGRTLAVGVSVSARSGFVRLFDAFGDGSESRLFRFEEYISALALDAQGEKLATGLPHRTDIRIIEPGLIADAISGKVRRNLSLGEWTEFVGTGETYQRVCTNLPIHDSYLRPGESLAEQGDVPGAVGYFKKVREIDPSWTLQPESYANQKFASAVIRLAEDDARKGRLAQAEEALRKARRIDPTLQIDPATEARRFRAETLALQAARRDRPADLDSSIAALTEAIALNPTIAGSHSHLGELLQEKGLLAEAVEQYTAALQLAPRDWNTLANRANALARQQELDKAFLDLQEAFRIQDEVVRHVYFPPNRLGMVDRQTRTIMSIEVARRAQYKLRGLIYRLQDKEVLALRDFSKLLERGKMDVVALQQRALTLMSLDLYPLAVEDFSRLLTAEAEHSEALEGRARCFIALKKLDEALRDIDRATKIKPDNASHHYYRALVLREKGDRAAAKKSASTATQLDPTEPAYQELLRSLGP